MKAHDLVTYAAHNQVAPLGVAQAARDEYEQALWALREIVAEYDTAGRADTGGVAVARTIVEKEEKAKETDALAQHFIGTELDPDFNGGRR
jgi:hypothetical protein